MFSCLVYGKGYEWSKPSVTINIGDTVRWTWSAPVGATGIKYMIEQVETLASEVGTGFVSGAPSASGEFEQQFNEPGVYHYWTRYVEFSNTITLRGVITVLDSVDKELELSVRVGGNKGKLN